MPYSKTCQNAKSGTKDVKFDSLVFFTNSEGFAKQPDPTKPRFSAIISYQSQSVGTA